VIFVFMFSLLSPLDTPRSPLFSFDYLIRSYEHIRRNRQTDLLGGFQVDHQLKLHRLLDWEH
jgi:hypothetical protein